jgi:Domain of unknown function DUF11
MRRSVAWIVGVMTVVGVGASPAAAGAPITDVAVTRARANVASASTGDKIVFRGVVRDLGPDPVTDSLDIRFEGEGHISVRGVSCREPGVGEIVSNDGNFCEFGAAAVGARFVQRVKATVTGNAGDAKLTYCASTESAVSTDPDPTNDCRTVRVPITA